MLIQRGFRGKISTNFNVGQPVTVDIRTNGPASYDFCCFGVDQNDQLSDESYMIFYNQLSSPENAISMKPSNTGAQVLLRLNELPVFIKKLVFTISIDGDGSMANITDGNVVLHQPGKESIELALSGSQFQAEKAIIGIEIYYKEEWRISAIARGFNGGLSDLLKHYGGEESFEHPAAPPIVGQPLQQKISLEKQLLEKAPHLVDLSKKLTFKLEKIKLDKLVAQVAIVLDASGSMVRQYREGKVQKVLERLLLLALRFDDNGEFELWAFAEKNRKYPSVNIENYQGYVANLTKNSRYVPIPALGGTNNEAPVIKKVKSFYNDTKLPVYVLFISDGGVKSNKEISQEIIAASTKPIFWQFVGLGGRNYGIFEKLDTLEGRYVDNSNFFAVDDIDKMSDDELYNQLLQEFSLWLKQIKKKGMI